MDFVRGVVQKHADKPLIGGKVMELGSHDCNNQSAQFGLIRDLFGTLTDYVGVDFRPGPNVDRVALFHEALEEVEELLDCVVSAEAMEHDPFWKETLFVIADALKPGGLFIFTFASESRGAHELDATPQPGYYHGISRDEFMEAAKDLFSSIESEYARGNLDIYGWAVK